MAQKPFQKDDMETFYRYKHSSCHPTKVESLPDGLNLGDIPLRSSINSIPLDQSLTPVLDFLVVE